MTFPSFPTHRLYEFHNNSNPRPRTAKEFYDAGFPHLFLRMFLTQEQHVWLNLEFPYHVWTGQVVWFNDEDERERFIERWLYPTYSLWWDDHEFAIQLEPPEHDVGALVEQMNALGADINIVESNTYTAHAKGMINLADNGPFPSQYAVWVSCTEDQAMIARMCGLTTLTVPKSHSRLGPCVEGISLDQSTETRKRNLLGNFGITWTGYRS